MSPARAKPPLPAPHYTMENPQPRLSLSPEPAQSSEAGFYIVPRSMPPGQLLRSLFDTMPDNAIAKYSRLNPDLQGVIKAGTLVVLSDGHKDACTYKESQLMQAAREVGAALEPLTPDEADFMMRHADEISSFTGQASTWLGVSSAVMEKHLTRFRETLQSIEYLHQNSFKKHGHLNSPEFFAERKRLLSQLDAHLLNSKNLRNLTTIDDHRSLKRALGISSHSLIHHWRKAGSSGPIPGYAKHVEAMSRAAKYMQAGGYIGIGIGGVSSLLETQEVCNSGTEEECRKVRYKAAGKFALSSGLGYVAGDVGFVLSGPVCAALGATTGIGGVACVAALVGVSSFAGTAIGNVGGEFIGEKLYEVTLP